MNGGTPMSCTSRTSLLKRLGFRFGGMMPWRCMWQQ